MFIISRTQEHYAVKFRVESKMKSRFSLVIWVLSGVIVFSTAAETKTNTLQSCLEMEDDYKRLLCYDNLATLLAKKDLSVESNKVVTPVLKNTQSFGLEHKNLSKEKQQDLTSAVVSLAKAPFGELIITLENKQQWRQIGSQRFRLSKADIVTISRGAFSSFLLKKQGQNKSIRVKRIK